VAQNDQPGQGQNPQGGGRGGAGNTMRGGTQPTQTNPRQQQQQPDERQVADATDPTRPGAETRVPGTMPSVRRLGAQGAGGPDPRAPLTGEGFRDWSDRMRDVEEIVNDPKMRAAAAAIRERAAAIRAQFKKNGEEPDWNVVQETINKPLFELRDQVAQELLKRQSPQALVPIDREPVPPQYADEVRRYYERLGSGK
jgi:hypothetical protein